MEFRWQILILFIGVILLIALSNIDLPAVSFPKFAQFTVGRIPVVKMIDAGNYYEHEGEEYNPIFNGGDLVGYDGCLKSGGSQKDCKKYEKMMNDFNPNVKGCYESGHPITCHNIYWSK